MKTNHENEYRRLVGYLSTITELMIENEVELARELGAWLYKRYGHIEEPVGKYTLSQHLNRIARQDEERLRTAERAMTIGVILRSRYAISH